MQKVRQDVQGAQITPRPIALSTLPHSARQRGSLAVCSVGTVAHKRVAFVSGPYRAATLNGVHENIAAARVVAIALWQIGLAVVCPHLNTAYFDGTCPDSAWLEGDKEILSRCDLIVMLPTWRSSTGARGEQIHATSLLIPVYYWPTDRERLHILAASTMV